MNRRSMTISISGVIALLATIIIAIFCIHDWSGLTGWAFSTILWSEIIFFGGLVFVEWVAEKTEQLITRSALYVWFSGYAIVNIPVSILFILFFKQAISAFIVIEVLLLAVVVIAIVLSLSISKGIHQSNKSTMEHVISVESMVERLNKLAVTPTCKAYASALRKMGEELRFTDCSVGVKEDEEISKVIAEMEIDAANDDEKAGNTIRDNLVKLKDLIAKRKLSASSVKKGRV